MSLFAPEAYGVGKLCTWHGPLTFALPAMLIDWNSGTTQPAAACPCCGQPLQTMLAAIFWGDVAAEDRKHRDYKDMMRWSEGKCFPDPETMLNAYRQHMEGRV